MGSGVLNLCLKVLTNGLRLAVGLGSLGASSDNEIRIYSLTTGSLSKDTRTENENKNSLASSSSEGTIRYKKMPFFVDFAVFFRTIYGKVLISKVRSLNNTYF